MRNRVTGHGTQIAKHVHQKLRGHKWKFSHMHDDGMNLYEVDRCDRCSAVRIDMGPAQFVFANEHELIAAEKLARIGRR